MHAFTPKNDEFNSVDCRQEIKGTYASTPRNGKFNSVEGRQEIKGTYASTPKNDESNSVEGQQEFKRTHGSTPKNDEFNLEGEGEYEIKLIERDRRKQFLKIIFYYHFTCSRDNTHINKSNLSHRICSKQYEKLNKKDHRNRTGIEPASSDNR